jgi:hypothetical protein
MIPNRRIIASGHGLLSGNHVVIYQEDSPVPDIEIERFRDTPVTWWEWFVRLFGG